MQIVFSNEFPSLAVRVVEIHCECNRMETVLIRCSISYVHHIDEEWLRVYGKCELIR